MSRIRIALLAIFAAAAPAVTLTAGPAAAATPSVGWSSLRAAEDDLSADPADEADPADDAVEVDLGDLCTPDSSSADSAAADDAEDPQAQDDATDPGDGSTINEADDPADDAADDADPAGDPDAEDPCAVEQDQADPADDPGATKDGGTKRVPLKEILKTGTVDVGGVTLAGPGTVTEELWITRPGGSSVRLVAAAAASRKQRAAVKKPKVPKKILAGKATKTVTRGGVVHLTVKLTAAARKILKGSKKDVRITVKTTTKGKGAMARTRTGVVIATDK